MSGIRVNIKSGRCSDCQMSMKIHVIFTGGTIGSRVNKDKNICVDEGFVYKLISEYKRLVPSCDDEFNTSQPYTVLSENLCADHIKLLVKEINRVIKVSDTDAVIITHGTDTMQYSAAILSYLFDCINIPIILVSSDFPLEDERANGFINFHFALKFIHECTSGGVFVSYCNKGDYPVIHRGSRLNLPVTLSADVFSVSNSYVVKYYYEDGQIKPVWNELPGENEMPDENEMAQRICDPYKLILSDRPDIMRVVPYVGMRYGCIPEGTKAILHESFHSGTIAITNELSSFVKEASKRNIPVFLTGLSSYENQYETVLQYKKMGIIAIPDSSVISQYCKLWLLTDNYSDMEYVKNMMNKRIAHDWVIR